MSEPTKRFSPYVESPGHEQCNAAMEPDAHGDYVRYEDFTLATQRAEAAEAERDGLKFAQQHIVAERDALRKDACKWWDDDQSEPDGNYATSCKQGFGLNEPGIEYNGIKFCPFCGGSIVYETPEVEPDEDDDAALAVQPTTEGM